MLDAVDGGVDGGERGCFVVNCLRSIQRRDWTEEHGPGRPTTAEARLSVLPGFSMSLHRTSRLDFIPMYVEPRVPLLRR